MGCGYVSGAKIKRRARTCSEARSAGKNLASLAVLLPQT
jgi:hypothetical protein